MTQSIYDDMKIELPHRGVNLFWSDPKNPKTKKIKEKYENKHNNP